jgi:hypothetical protein
MAHRTKDSVDPTKRKREKSDQRAGGGRIYSANSGATERSSGGRASAGVETPPEEAIETNGAASDGAWLLAQITQKEWLGAELAA